MGDQPRQRAKRSGGRAALAATVRNSLMRLGLSAPHQARRKPGRVRPAALGGLVAGANLDRALALADAPEDQELAARMQLRT